MISPDAARHSVPGAAPLRWGTDGVSSPEQAFVLPVGTVTFLLTDVAGSTQLWERESDESMRAAIVRHYEILSAAVDAHGGVRPQEQGEGDSIVAAFARPSDALAAASVAQTALAAEPWTTSDPLRVRMAIHTGEAHLRDDANYAGQAIIRTARLRNIGHGGQVLVSGATRDLAVDQTGIRFDLRPLGEHRLRDLGRPEHVWQLVVPGAPDEFDDLVTLDSVPNTLPVSLSPFIGREPEIAELAGLVSTERLVTATGTGGAGKTRLAQQVGAELIDQFPVGVWWVDLAPLDRDGVESAVRVAFGISEGAQTAFEEAVRRQLGDERCLLIVDNCEHVTDTVAPLLDRLLRHAPMLHVLATSRVMLDLPGEHAWRVPALALPDRSAVSTVEALSQFDAVRLFCDRARRARPNFDLTTANGPIVAEICHRLDGIPLAIELAAARTRMLDPQRILDGLDDAFRILAGGSKALMPRQQTLEASIAWSHDLLSPSERTLLRRLSVFVDGWTLDTAEAVCPDPEEGEDALDAFAVFDALDRLVDHSLVHTVDTPMGLRFGMLETIRQFALRQLAADPEEHEAAIRRHSAHFLDWTISLGDDLLLGCDVATLDGIPPERANILTATDTAIARGDFTGPCHALAALAPVLEIPDWAPMSPKVFAQLDRLQPRVEPEDQWLVHFVRQKMYALRGNPMSELETLEGMRQSAEAAGQAVGVGISRYMTLSIFATAGLPVLDEMKEVVDDLERHSPGWAANGRKLLAVIAAYQGRLVLVDEALAKTDSELRGPIHRGAVDLATGMLAFSRGEPLVARAAVTAALEGRYLYLSATNVAGAFLAFAGADLGVDLTAVTEARLRRSYEVDGNVLGSVTADGLRALHHLLNDDVATADMFLRRSTDTSASIGMNGGWPNERYALVAAGVGDYEDQLAQEGGPTLTSSNHRARAEQHLQRGDFAAALDDADVAIAIGLAERGYRNLVTTLDCVSRVFTAAGRHTEAARLLGACDAFRAERSSVRYPCLQRLADAAAEASRAALGDEAFDTALTEGSTLSLEAAADYARRLRSVQASTTVGWDALTPAEARVAELVAEGLTNPQVAKELLMGAETVKTHLSRVFDKVGVANRKELIVAASRRAADRHR